MLAVKRRIWQFIWTSLLLVSTIQAVGRCPSPYPDRCDCDPPQQNKTGTIVYCRHLHLDYVPPHFPEDTVSINFGDNSITTVTADSFKNVPILHTLLLDNCEIETITEDAFSHLTSLKILSLANNKIQSLHPGTFDGLTQLEELYLSGNELADVPDLLFTGLTLSSVDLQQNKIQFISERAFEGASITRLYMNNNDVGSMSERALGPLKHSLKSLELSHNRQPLHLQESVFTGFSFDELTLCNNGLMNTSFLVATKATNLDIGANPLNSVDFQNYSNLQYTHKLYLRNVSIDNLNDVTLVNLREVALLDLSRNKLEDVLTSVFRFTPNLDILILSENQLSEVPRNLGNYLSDLRELDLSRNKISVLRPEDFESLYNLQKLELMLNKIQVISESMKPVFDRISMVRLDTNPLHCNCEMRWFREWLDVYRTSMGVEDCFTPQFQYIFNMEYQDFVCTAPVIKTITSNQTVSRGANVFLACTAESDPAPQVEWSAPFGDVISINPTRNRTRLRTIAYWKIDRILPEQAGVYTCTGSNMAGLVQSHICVQIQENGSIISDPCVYPTHPAETTAQELPTTLELTTTVTMTTAQDAMETTSPDTPGVTTSVSEDATTASTSTAKTTTVRTTTTFQNNTTFIPTNTPKGNRPSGSPPVTGDTQQHTGEESNTTIIYIVIGVVAGLVVVVIIILAYLHSRKKRKEKRDYELARKANGKSMESQA